METSDRLGSEVIARLYGAATAPDPVGTMLEAVALPLGCEVAALSFVDGEQRAVEQSRFIGVDAEVARLYDERWLSRERSSPGLPAGSLVARGDDLRRSHYYRRFLRPLGLWDVARGCVAHEQRATTVLSLWRPRARGIFSDREVEIGSLVMPHLRRTLELRRRLDLAERRERALASSLDLLGSAVLLLDNDGGVLFANRTGQALLEDGDLLRLVAGRVSAGGPLPKLERLVVSALGRGLDGRPRPGAASLELPRGPLMASVAPLPVAGSNAALVLLRDPSAPPVAGVGALLRSLWGLTSTEARLAVELASSPSVREVSVAMQISYETARSHLRRIFTKTGVHRQSELIRLVLALPGVCEALPSR